MASHIVKKIIYLSLLDWTIRINFAFVAKRITTTFACQEILTIYLIVVLSGIVAIVTSCWLVTLALSILCLCISFNIVLTSGFNGSEARCCINLGLPLINDLPHLIITDWPIMHGILIAQPCLLHRECCTLGPLQHRLRIPDSLRRPPILLHAFPLVGVLRIGAKHTVVGHGAGWVHTSTSSAHRVSKAASYRSLSTFTCEDHVLLDRAYIPCSLVKAYRLLNVMAFRHESTPN